MAARPWQMFGFMDAVREWMRRDPPSDDLMVKVAAFGADLEEDPERDATSEHANLFFREMPGTEHDGHIVSITFELNNSSDPAFAGVIRCQDVVCVVHPRTALFETWPPKPHHR